MSFCSQYVFAPKDDQISQSKRIDDWPVVLVGCLMGASMGFHNIAAKESVANCPPTTVHISNRAPISR